MQDTVNTHDYVGNLRFVETVNGLGHKSGYWKCEKCLTIFEMTINNKKMLMHVTGNCK